MKSKLYEKALLQMDNGNNKKSAETFKQAIVHKNVDALFALGVMYLHGEGVPLDIEKGKELILKAKRKKHPVAMFYWDIIND